MIKLFLLILVVLTCSLIGYIINLYFKEKVLLYDDFVRMCNDFKNEIYFLQTDVSTLLNKYNCGKSTRSMLENYLKNGKCSSVFLKKEECENFGDFLSSMGHCDVDGEINNLTYWENVFKTKQENAKLFYDKYGLAILKLSIIFGAILSIMML